MQRQMQGTRRHRQHRHLRVADRNAIGLVTKNAPNLRGRRADAYQRPVKLDHDTISPSLPHAVMTFDQQHRIGLRRARKAQTLQHPRSGLQLVLADQQVNVVIPTRLTRPIQPASDGGTLQQHVHDARLVQPTHHLAQTCIHALATCRRCGPQPKINQTLIHGRSTLTPPPVTDGVSSGGAVSDYLCRRLAG
jgi:hypothetical protein